MKNKYAILDLCGLVIESYHSGQDSQAIPGDTKEYVNTAEFGFGVFCSKYFQEIIEGIGNPKNIIAVTDGGNNYRRIIFPAYKENRRTREVDKVESQQIKKATRLVLDFLKAVGCQITYLTGQEADDVIAYLCENLTGIKRVYTVDKDLIALNNSTPGKEVFVFRRLMHETILEDKGVTVPSNLITLYKSKVGDSSDNYKGIYRFGPAAWSKLVDAFGHDGMQELSELVDSQNKHRILQVADLACNKVLDKCVESLDDWFLCYRLAKLHPEIVNIPKGDSMQSLVWVKRCPEPLKLLEVCNSANAPDIYDDYKHFCITMKLVTQDNLQESLQEIDQLLGETEFVAWDYESYDTIKSESFKKAVKGRDYVDVLSQEVTGCSFALGANTQHVYYFSCGHRDTNNIDAQVIKDTIIKIEGLGIPMVAHNVIFEGTLSQTNFSHRLKYYEDTSLYAHHINENSSNKLKDLSLEYLGYHQTTYQNLLEQHNASDMTELSGEQVLNYGCDDSYVTASLYTLFRILSDLEGTRNFIETYECPATEMLIDSHVSGALLDVDEVEMQIEEAEATMLRVMPEIRELLEEHCSIPNFDAVEAFYEEEKSFISKRNPDDRKAALKRFKSRLKENCFYTPMTETWTYKKFIPTVTVFKIVTDDLGLPPIAKTSVKGIGEYLDSVSDLTLTAVQAEFISKLAPAERDFKSRDGDKYMCLAEFCNNILSKYGKSVTSGTELNFDSPNQNQYLLYLLLGLPIRLKTPPKPGSSRESLDCEGSPSTDEDTIACAMAWDCDDAAWKKEVLEKILEYKAVSTLKSYLEILPLWLRRGNNIHPGVKPCGTITRRITGNSPNFLQAPKGPPRRVIKAHPGCVIASIDFSGQELRINADACQDPTFLSAYAPGSERDLHILTGTSLAPELLSSKGIEFPDDEGAVEYEFFKEHLQDDTEMGEIFTKCRKDGKTINFSLQFGAQEDKLAVKLLISKDMSEKYIKAYNATYPGLQVWKDQIVKKAKRTGYSETFYGSRRHVIPGIAGGKKGSRWARQAINAVIQGTASDIMKVVLTNLARKDFLRSYDSSLIAVIYDELLLEIPIVNLQAALEEVCNVMTLTPPGGTVSQMPDCSFGLNWYDQHEVGYKPTQKTIDQILEKIQ